MIITSPRGSVIEKIFKDASGRMVKALFYVYESEGRVKARLLEAIYLEEALCLEQGVWVLPAPLLDSVSPLVLENLYFSIPSPYSLEELLYFVGAKPRAPTL